MAIHKQIDGSYILPNGKRIMTIHKQMDGSYILSNGKRIHTYTIYRDNIKVEERLFGWRTALAHARKYRTDLFTYVRKVEILNECTGEVISLEEAEKRAARLCAKS